MSNGIFKCIIQITKYNMLQPYGFLCMSASEVDRPTADCLCNGECKSNTVHYQILLLFTRIIKNGIFSGLIVLFH